MNHLKQFIEQLNVVYKVTDKPRITFPLNDSNTYLLALELRRSQMALTEQVKKHGVIPGDGTTVLAEFYQNVYDEIVEMMDE